MTYLQSTTTGPLDGAEYELRLLGVLGDEWGEQFAGFEVETQENTTRIVGRVPDQAALHGLLRTVRDRGLTLLCVRRLDSGAEKEEKTHAN